MTNFDKLKAMVYGLAVGDALGVPYEFKSRYAMEKNPCTGMVGGGTHGQPAGSWSDDTSMTLCLLDATDYGTGTVDLEKTARNFISWMDCGKFTALGNLFDIGNTTWKAIRNMRGKKAAELPKCGITGNHDGNGALMRISPLVPLVDGRPMAEWRPMVADAVTMTHGNRLNVVACLFYCAFMGQLWNGKEKREALGKTAILFDGLFRDEPEWPRIRKAIMEHASPSGKNGTARVNAGGFVVKTLSASICCLMRAGCYGDAVLAAVNLGGDTDTTAAVTGSMAGLCFGFESIPEKWVNALLNRELIDDTMLKSMHGT